MSGTGRRWLRRGVVTLTVLVVAHLALTFISGRRLVRTLERVEARFGSLAADAHAPSPVAPERNQARALQAAVDAMRIDDEALGTLGRFNAGREVDPTAVLARNARTLEHLDEAAARSASDWELEYERLLDTELPPLLELRKLATLNIARSRQVGVSGDPDEALELLSRGWSINRSLSYEPILICQLLALAVEEQHLSELREALGSPELRPQTLEKWSTLLERAQQGPERHIGLIGEMKLVNVYHDFETGGRRGGPLPPGLTLWPVRWLLRPFFRENFRAFMERLSAYAEYDLVPFYERPERFTTSPQQAPFRFYQALARTLLPSLGRYTQQRDVLDAERQIARVGLELRRHVLEAGAYPETLGGLEIEATDPFSGRPLHYEFDDRSVTLTSAGAELDELEDDQRERLVWTWPY